MERLTMIVLVAALLLMGIVLGAVVQIPLPMSLALGALIGCWLLVFAVRERTGCASPLAVTARTSARTSTAPHPDPKESAP
ncbi:hypothetical protein [Streptomyces sp. NPDC050422]|uniref:hypothetical protein n=1 Tax=Streptomyces sp. NPDC050422 TaxID=3365614 RepID=UPI00378E2477